MQEVISEAMERSVARIVSTLTRGRGTGSAGTTEEGAMLEAGVEVGIGGGLASEDAAEVDAGVAFAGEIGAAVALVEGVGVSRMETRVFSRRL